jgi:hypothetical protein
MVAQVVAVGLRLPALTRLGGKASQLKETLAGRRAAAVEGEQNAAGGAGGSGIVIIRYRL